MAERKKITFCMECRKETPYALHKEAIKKIIREKEYTFAITTARCKECGCEIGFHGLLDYNAREIDTQYRRMENIVTIEEIEKLGKIYSLGKAPLSLALGFGEVTITRYLAGQIPSKEYSDLIRKALADTSVMSELLNTNKDKLAPAAYHKAISAIRQLNSLFQIPSKMLMVISCIFEELEEVTPLALQKMLYYIQGLYYSRYGTPVFAENCEAWVHGPVYTKVYNMFSEFRYDPIHDPRFELLKGKSSDLSSEERELIELVINTFGMYSGKTLEKITHRETPWLTAREGYAENEPSNEEISKESIKAYFNSIRTQFDMDSENGIMEYISYSLQNV